MLIFLMLSSVNVWKTPDHAVLRLKVLQANVASRLQYVRGWIEARRLQRTLHCLNLGLIEVSISVSVAVGVAHALTPTPIVVSVETKAVHMDAQYTGDEHGCIIQ